MKNIKQLVPAFSLEGDAHTTNERRGKGVYEHIITTMDKMSREKMLFGTSITLTRENYDMVMKEEFITKKAIKYLHDDVLFVMGGFCLSGHEKEAIQEIITKSQQLNIQYIAPTHCTGDLAKGLFEKAYGERYIEVGTGKMITLSDFSMK